MVRSIEKDEPPPVSVASPIRSLGSEPAHVEEPRADEGVGGRAVDEAAPTSRQAVDLARLEVDGVAVEAVWPEKPVRLVGVEVVAGLGVEAADPGDLVGLFGDVGLHQAVGCSAQSAPSASSCAGVEVGEKRGVMT
jgi:hypothetical protein